MSKLLGLHTNYALAANQTATSNTTLASIADFTIALAANQRCKIRGWVPFALAGAVSGAKFQLLPPTSPTAFLMSAHIYNGASTGTLAAFVEQTVSASFSNALANATNHLLTFEAWVQALTAGNLALQFAQLVSDPGVMTILANGVVDVWVF